MALKIHGTDSIQSASIQAASLAPGVSGGPKITSIAVTDSNYATLDDTAVDIAGGYIKITGAGFAVGALVYFNQTPANSVGFTNSTELRVSVPALAAGTYVLYVINTDGGVAISVPGVTFSATPSWQTASSLAEQGIDAAITLNLVATDATSYTITSGSLPPGLSLNSSTGAITGTVTGLSVDTTYTFTVRATDAQNQDSPRTFTVTVSVADPYFKLTTLLLNGDSGNTVVTDSSTNNFNLTVYGDSRASNFTPYSTGWSNYFDGSGDSLEIPDSAAFDMGSQNYTIEGWMYPTSYPGTGSGIVVKYAPDASWVIDTSGNNWEVIVYYGASSALIVYAGALPALNAWHHFVLQRSGANIEFYVDGVRLASVGAQDMRTTSALVRIGCLTTNSAYPFSGSISNVRIVKGTAVYTSGATITVPTAPLTAISGTSLLTCHVNSFRDVSANNFAITRNGDVKVVSFNPFNITNTGDSGSMYFDGTGDYLTLPAAANVNPGSGEFCFESWIYLTATPGATTASIYNNLATSGAGNTQFNVGVNSSLQVQVTGWATAHITSSAITLNAWYHIAVCRTGTTLSLFINGSRSAGGTTTSSQDFSSTTAYYIGRYPDGTAQLTGYISNLRVVKGSTPYDATSSTITVPTTPLTAIANTQLLTLQYRQPHNNHGFQDSSANQFLITRNGNATQGTFSPFSPSGWSVYLDGSGDTLSMSQSIVNALTTMTIEGWFYINSSGTLQGLWGGGVDLYGINLQYQETANQKLHLFIGTGGAWSQGYVSNTTLTPYAWYHIAYVRSGTSHWLYINGVVDSSINGVTNSVTWSGGTFYIGTPQLTTRNYNGFISNFRVSNSIRYNGTFTPTTSSFSSDANTVLLTCQSNRFIDTSNNNYAISRNGDAKVVNFSPFAPTQAYSPSTHGGSAYFDGTGDYLTFTDSANNLDLGGIAASVEAWIYPLSVTGNRHIISKSGGDPNWSTTSGIYWIMRIVDSQFGCEFRNGTVVSVITGGTAILNTWHHIVIATDTSNNIALFVNGTRVGTASNAITKPTTRTLIQVGDFGGSNVPSNGYITGIVFKNGTNAYTPTSTTLAVPTAPLTAITNTSLLLNFTDAAIVDRTGRTVLETVADAKTSSVVTKYGTGSMYFDGTGDWVITPTTPNFGYGTGDFTIEFWMYWTGAGTQTILSNLTNSSSSNPHLYLNAGVLVYFTAGADRITGPSITANQWYHIALSRASGSTKLFVNGTQSGSTYADSNNYGTTAPFGLATYWNNGTPNSASVYSGYIDDLRITKGYARYTANFTPPSQLKLK